MKYGAKWKLAPGVLLALAVAGSAWAQPASQSMHQAGQETESAVGNAYHGTKTAVKDTDITAKVKMALHDDQLTKGAGIHVTTVDGVVTLRGTVASGEIADRAQHLARGTSGVTGVSNQLRIGG